MKSKSDVLHRGRNRDITGFHGKHTGSCNACYSNPSDSDSESKSDSLKAPRAGLRGSRWKHYTPAEKLAARTVKSDDPNGCWEFLGRPTCPNGYTHISTGSPSTGTHQRVLAHRLAYELAYGPIPKGAVIMHSCDNPRCVNPAHLSVGTQQDNIRDAVRKGRWSVRKLSDDDVATIRSVAVRTHQCYRELAETYGVSFSTIRHIVAGRVRTERIEQTPPLAQPAVVEPLTNVEPVKTVLLPVRGDLHVGSVA